MSRSVGRRSRFGILLDRALGREPGEREPIAAERLRDPAEDVWKALRF